MALNIGMSVPGSSGSSLYDSLSPAQQVDDETEEQRKRRLQAMQQAKQLPSGVSSLASGYGAALSTR